MINSNNNKVAVKFVFEDWKKDGVSIYQTEEGVDLSMGDFHHGSLFTGTMELDMQEFEELQNAVQKGYTPVFNVSIISK